MRRRAVVALLICLAGVAAAGVLLVGGDEEQYRVRILFADAAGLVEASQVKIGGVPAGEVTKLELTARDQAQVEVELEQGAGPIGAGARAQVRPVTLLGEKYIDLRAGDPGRPLASGSTIPATRTSAAVELDDVLNMLDRPTRAALRVLINEAGIAMRGRGADFNGLLAELPSSLDETEALLSEVGSDNARLRRLVEQGDRVIASVSSRRDDLGRLVDTAQGALAATADRRAELGATVRSAPGTLRQLRGTLTRLGTTTAALTPVAGALRSAAPPLAATLQALPRFEVAARGALREARNVSPVLRRLAATAVPIVRRVRPTARLLSELAAELSPLVNDTLDRDGAFQWLLTLAHNWGRATSRRDAAGHWFQGNFWLDQTMVKEVIDLLEGRSGRRRKRRGSQREARSSREASRSERAPRGGGSSVAPSGVPEPVPLQPRSAPSPSSGESDLSGVLDYLLAP